MLVVEPLIDPNDPNDDPNVKGLEEKLFGFILAIIDAIVERLLVPGMLVVERLINLPAQQQCAV